MIIDQRMRHKIGAICLVGALLMSGCATPMLESARPSAPADDSGESYEPSAEYDSAVVEEASEESAVANTSETMDTSAPQAPSVSKPYDAPQNPAYNNVFFEDYGVNPFIDTEDDHLSTFATDVDTGSYTVVRRHINDGYLPPADAVRVEEFVNFFEQGYEYPPEGQAFGIYMDAAPAPYTQSDRYQMMRVGLQGYDIAPEDRKDVSLTFVIDVSGSMEQENRLTLVKRALTLLVEQLRPTDAVSIVVYGSNARVVLPATTGEHKNDILDAIFNLHTEGATNAEAGLRAAYYEATMNFDPDKINRVILASDGVANVGNTGAESIWDTVGNAADHLGITLTTIGVGMGNYNDVLMEQMADIGNGFYAYVDDIEEAERIFVTELTGTLQTIAMDAKVQVDFNPDVVARYRLVGFENRDVADDDFRDDEVDAGEIGAGHSVTAIYEIKLQPEAEGSIATVYMRWQDPDNGEAIEIKQDFHTEQVASAFENASPYFQQSVIVAEYAEVLRESYWAQDGSLASVRDEAVRVVALLPESAESSEFVRLVQEAMMLAE